jgi:hypothetical protein
MIAMAVEMTRETRKRPKSGVGSPVEGIDDDARCQLDRPADQVNFSGPLCRKPLKDIGLPASLLLVSAQIPSDHCKPD